MRTSLRISGEIRVPGLIEGRHPPAPYLSLADSVQLLVDFLRKGKGKTTLLTGAGISAYRGPGGTYTIRKHRPIFYGEFIQDEAMRRRYWARSFLGYPPVRRAESNPTHYAMAALQKMGYLSSLITQNVDGLHHRAYSDDLSLYLSPPSVKPTEAPDAPLPPLDPAILELHGTLRHAHCLSCHTPVGRDSFQDRLSELNPAWHEFQKEVESGKREEKLNPDGDIELGPGVRYEDFQVPACDQCGGPMKPRVIFFGESLEPLTRRHSEHFVSSASQLLVAGSSLATFSAYRLVRQMKEQGGPVGLINVGESRADPIVDWRVGWEGGAGDIFPEAVKELLKDEKRPDVKAEVERMLKAGKVRKVPPGPAAS
ncbi:NAD-dependent protein deacylase SIR4 [Rhodotorula toruloides]|nr:NAD-dependent protein deacylase SIR4 [Rhodotorula toruloides]